MLHDDEAGVRVGMRRRKDQVAVRARVAARLAQHALPQAVTVLLEMTRFFKHGAAGHVEHTADDHAAGLAGRVRIDGLDHAGDAHQACGLSRASASAERRGGDLSAPRATPSR